MVFLELIILKPHKLFSIDDLNGKTKMVVPRIDDQPALVKLQRPCLLGRYLKSWMHVVVFDGPPGRAVAIAKYGFSAGKGVGLQPLWLEITVDRWTSAWVLPGLIF